MRTKAITLDDLHETRATCLWDLDQFIGEEGWDREMVIITLGDGFTITCQGREVKRLLTEIHRDVDNITRIERQEA